MSSPKLPPWPPGKTWLRKLATKKHRREYGVYLLEGSSAIEDAVMAGAQIYGLLYDSRSLTKPVDKTLLEWFVAEDYSVRETGQDELQAVSGLATTPPLVAIARQEPAAKPTLPVTPGLVLALDNVNDPGNVGTLIRVASFYGLKEVWLGEGTAELYNPKTIRAAMASHLHVRVCQPVDLAARCKQATDAGATLLASVIDNAEAPTALDQNQAGVLILGSEAHGLSDTLLNLADKRVAIQRRGQVDSLNVAMAGAILIDRLLG